MLGGCTRHRHTTVLSYDPHHRHALFHRHRRARHRFHHPGSAAADLPDLEVEATVARRDSADKADKQDHPGLQDKTFDAEAIASASNVY